MRNSSQSSHVSEMAYVLQWPEWDLRWQQNTTEVQMEVQMENIRIMNQPFKC